MNKEIIIKRTGAIMHILFIAFLVFKLTKVINWSWWWVTSPLWIPIIFVIVGSAIFIFVKAIKMTKNESNC